MNFKPGDKVLITKSRENWCGDMDKYVDKIGTLLKARYPNAIKKD